MRRNPFILAGLLAASALPACIEEAPLAHKGEPRRPSAAQAARTPAPVTRAPAVSAPVKGLPAGTSPGGAVFGGALEVVGYKVEPPAAPAGGVITVTTYLRVSRVIPIDYQMFVHVDDAEGKPVRINGDHWPAGHKVPMPQWRPGELVEDRFQVTLDGFDQSTAATVWLGFFEPQGGERLPITNADQVKTDGNNRYALATVAITP